MTTLTLQDTSNKIHSNSIEDLREQARAFISEMLSECNTTYHGDFPETEDGEQEKKNFIENGHLVTRCWLKTCYPENSEGTPGMCITFRRYGSSESSSISKTFWLNNGSWKGLSDEEREALREKRKKHLEKSRKQAEEEKAIADEMADKAFNRFGDSLGVLPPKDAVTYFSKKGLDNPYDIHNLHWELDTDYTNGTPKENWIALVALCDIKDNIRAIQELWPDENNRRKRGKHYAGKTRGNFYTIPFGSLKNGDKILLSEGLADATTNYLATKTTSVSAGNSGNLQPVLHELTKRYPKSEITMCADNDHEKEAKGEVNIGLKKAREAALKYRCKLAIPEFPEGEWFDKESGKPRTDFDDLRQICGLNAVKEQIEKAKFATLKGNTLVENEVAEKNSEQINENTIIVEPGKIHEAVEASENLIRCKQIGIFQRAGQLVRIVIAGSKKRSSVKIRLEGEKHGRDPKTLIISEVEAIYLEKLLTKEGSWTRYDVRSKKLKPIDCPPKVARMLISEKDWDIDELNGVVRSPTLRQDGSIFQTPGYDQESGLYFHNDGTKFPKIKDQPTLEDALESLKIILNVYKGFPFENEISRSVAVSSVLTALIRRSISTAPAHAFTAPKMASGKSLLAEIVSIIVTGRRMTAMPQAENETEEKKRLLAVLLEGDPIVCYDNIEDPFGSPALCSVMTQTEFKDRILGRTGNAAVPTNTMFLITGNNLVFKGDFTTRVLLSKINPNVERPEEREFDVNLYDYIPKHRGEIIRAGLTILRAYHCADRPKQNISQFGRFEEWSDWVRSSLVWIGMEDPCSSRIDIEAEDPIRNQLVNLMNAWFDIWDDFSQLTKTVVNRSEKNESDSKTEALKEALLEIAPHNLQKGVVCHRKLGKYLSKNKGRIEGGLIIEKLPETKQNQALWKIKKA